MEQLLTTAQICEELQISKATLSRLCAAGTLNCHRIGNQLRFRRADLMEYLESTRLKPAPKRGRPQRRQPAVKAEPFDMEAYKAANIYIPPHPYFPGMKVVPGVSFTELGAGHKKSARTAGTGSGAGTQKRTTSKTILQQAERPVKTGGAES